MPDFLCPCHSNHLYKECCELFHQRQKKPNPLQLMRSRYSGYALKLADYIIQTTHLENPAYMKDKKLWEKQILDLRSMTIYEGLTIHSFEDGPQEAYVTFTAYLKQHGQDVGFKERSLFKKVGSNWLYHSGIISR